ncbi:MAG: hypothetical protein Q8Q60_00740 [Candidatus Chromulinivorax sp.]|nr:hypothetical protein [Candidatus Chromulinivorax sp.]
MNFIKTIFLFCTILVTNYVDATGADDLQKLMNKLSITIQQSRQSTQNDNERAPIHTDRSHDYDCETLYYPNGDYTRILFLGNEGIREEYNHATGRTTRTTFDRNQQL